jgi:4-hydroxy-tetrahydrodipicolinate reductase
MGKAVEKFALQKGHEVSLIIDNEDDWKLNMHKIPEADVAIDFSLPQTVVKNIYRFFDANIPVVVGTTGWNEQMEEVKKNCNEKNQSLLFSPNFSIGVNILFALNRKLAEIMQGFPQYDVLIEETHHKQKLDSPSGTAISLANDILQEIERKDKWINEPSSFNNYLEIKSFREDNISGIHNVLYTSEIDSIEIKHAAKNRDGFAIGALMAAEWIQNKKGMFTMNDMLNF